MRRATSRVLVITLMVFASTFMRGTAEAASSASIIGLFPSAEVPIGTTVSFTVSTSGFTNPSYWLVDSFPGGVTSTSIDPSGNFLWTPNQDDIGSHTLTITVSDAEGASASASQQIVVDAAASVSIQSLAPSASINIGTLVSFSTTVSGLFNPTYSVADSFLNSSLQHYAINASGAFVWTPIAQDIGTHTIVVTAKDTLGNSATASTKIVVLQPTTITITGLTPGTSIEPGKTLTFFATSTGFTQPTYAISDSFSSGIGTSTLSIDTSGKVRWTPVYNDIGVHPISVIISDSSHNATTSLSITVLPVVAAPTVPIPTPAASTAPASNTPIFKNNTTPIPPTSNIFKTAHTPVKKSQGAPSFSTPDTFTQTKTATLYTSSSHSTKPATTSVVMNIEIPTTTPTESMAGFFLHSIVNLFTALFKLL